MLHKIRYAFLTSSYWFFIRAQIVNSKFWLHSDCTQTGTERPRTQTRTRVFGLMFRRLDYIRVLTHNIKDIFPSKLHFFITLSSSHLCLDPDGRQELNLKSTSANSQRQNKISNSDMLTVSNTSFTPIVSMVTAPHGTAARLSMSLMLCVAPRILNVNTSAMRVQKRTTFVYHFSLTSMLIGATLLLLLCMLNCSGLRRMIMCSMN